MMSGGNDQTHAAALAGLCVLVLVLVLAAACSVPSARGGVGTQCDKNSDCAAPLVCRLGHCRRECGTSEDCIAPAQCVRDERGLGGCQIPDERACALDSACTTPLVCRFGSCVNACATSRDCPPGQKCREGGGCVDDVRGRCVTDVDCPGDLVCGRDGRCREACREDVDCRDNDFCGDRPSEQCAERATACRDPDGDGLFACFVRCTDDRGCADLGASVRCIGAPSGVCRTSCASDPGVCARELGVEWFCGADDACAPLIPNPLAVDPTRDGGAGDGGAGDGGAGDGAVSRDGAVGDDAASGDSGVAPIGCSGAPLSGVRAFSVGARHTCAVRGTGAATEVLCWGSFGDIGAGGLLGSPCPVAVPALAGRDVVSLAAAGVHTCAVVDAGEVICWGGNASGELGRGVFTPSEAPLSVPGITDASGVTTDWTHTCVWRAGGSASCWGSNLWGTLGSGPCFRCNFFVMGTAGGDFATPRTVTAFASPQDLSMSAHVCGLESGRVVCWGKSGAGQCGPAAGVGFTDVVRVEVGNSLVGGGYTCALRGGDGSLHCFGANYEGQLGDGTTTQREMPMQVALPARVTDVDLGAHACAVLEDGSVHCWGDGRAGAILPGVDMTSPITSPTRVLDAGALEVGVGTRFTCVLLDVGEVRCWGDNRGGQLGNGTMDETADIVTVASP